jgi:hypothetical protein
MNNLNLNYIDIFKGGLINGIYQLYIYFIQNRDNFIDTSINNNYITILIILLLIILSISIFNIIIYVLIIYIYIKIFGILLNNYDKILYLLIIILFGFRGLVVVLIFLLTKYIYKKKQKKNNNNNIINNINS